jgi:hypothetical protein
MAEEEPAPDLPADDVLVGQPVGDFEPVPQQQLWER